MLETEIQKITGIAKNALRGGALSSFSIRERRAWTERHSTTVEEDAAYCLLGIFDISMPLIYGGREDQAFWRLDEKIQKLNKGRPFPRWEDAEAGAQGADCVLLRAQVNQRGKDCGEDESNGEVRVQFACLTRLIITQRFVVSESSGCLELSEVVSKFSLSGTHFDMNRFGKPTEETFERICEVIKTMV